MEKPIFIYDGSCTFCVRWVKRLRRVTGGKTDFAPYQKMAGQLTQIPKEAYKEAVYFIEPDGTVTRAAHAVFRALALSRWCGWTLLLYRHCPGFASVSELVYRFIAKSRSTSCSVHMTKKGGQN